MIPTIFELRGTPKQQGIVRQALRRCSFPWDRMIPGLRAKVGRDRIPVEWADLSRYAEQQEEAHGARKHGDDSDFDILKVRNRVLGLAWYSGKVTLDVSLERDRELAAEVFLSEGAHMVDFFDPIMDQKRTAIYNAFHPDEQDVHHDTTIHDGVDLGHGHGWFDVGGYYSWVGEAFMGGFVRAYSDVKVTIAFVHPPTDQAVAEIRAALTPAPDAPVYGLPWRGVFHDRHRSIPRLKIWNSPAEAVAAGRRPCGTCKP